MKPLAVPNKQVLLVVSCFPFS